MEDLKAIIAQNIIELRKNAKLTQAELAEKLNYSDKAVSKWERAESIPDVTVLKDIADLFSVTVDYLLAPHSGEEAVPMPKAGHGINHRIITVLSCMIAWLVAGAIFIPLFFSLGNDIRLLKIFLACIPADAIIVLALNSIWGNRRRNYIHVSVLVWSILVSLFVLFEGGMTLAVILAVSGAFAQAAIILWSKIRYRK